MNWKAIGGVGLAVVAVGVALSQAAPRGKPAPPAAPPPPDPAPSATPASAPPPEAAAPAKSPSTAAERAIARLKRDEAAIRSGRLSLHWVLRKGSLPGSDEPAAVRAAVERAPVIEQRREYLLFSGADWRRDVTVTDASGNVEAEGAIGVSAGVSRMLQKARPGRADETSAVVGEPPGPNAVEYLLRGRGGEYLQDVGWVSAKPAGKLLELRGSRGDELVTAVLRTTPRSAVERLVLVKSLEMEGGSVTRTQRLQVTYEAGPQGLAPKVVEELTYLGKPVGQALLVRCKVEGAQINTPVSSDALEVELPQGTAVSDTRFSPPLRYKQRERDLTKEELQELHSRSMAKVGRPAPDWELSTLENKRAKLSDYRGKVVLLTWFASW